MTWMTLLIFTLTAIPAQQYAGDPLRIGTGARALGMGSAFVAVSDAAPSLYWNTAGLTQVQRTELHAQHAERYGGSVNHDNIVLATPTTVGVFAIGLERVGVSGITLSTLEDPASPVGPGNRPLPGSTTSTADYTVSAGYGRVIRDNLSVGAALKLVWRNLSSGNGTGYGIDLGLQYTPAARWRLGLVLRDATRTRITFDSGARDDITPTVNIGAAYTHPLPRMSGSLLLATAILLNEDVSAVEDGQRLRAGLEYRHQSGVSGRLGMEGNHFTAGAGIEPADRIRVDLAFLQNGELDNTYRLSASLYF